MKNAHITSERQRVIQAIEDCSAQSGLKPTTICQYAVKNRNLYDNLRNGLDCQVGTIERLMHWIAASNESRAV